MAGTGAQRRNNTTKGFSVPLTAEEFTARYRHLAERRGRGIGDLNADLVAKLQLGQERALGNYERALEAALAAPAVKTKDTSRLERLIGDARYLTVAEASLEA